MLLGGCGEGKGVVVVVVVAWVTVARKRGVCGWNGAFLWGEGLWRAICCFVLWKRRWAGEAVVVVVMEVEVEAALQGVMRAGWSFTHRSAERRLAGWEESMIGDDDWDTRLLLLGDGDSGS